MARSYIQSDSPPSSYAVAAVLDGEHGGWARVAGLTLVRAFAVAPGVWLGLRLADAKPTFKQVAVAALVGSAAITALLFVMYAVQRADAEAADY